MKRVLIVSMMLLMTHTALGYEYHLQYTPPAGGRLLNVAGYSFSGNDVVGACNYSVTTPCSGRGCHSNTYYYYNTCTWDLYGSLLSTTAVTYAPPTPLYTTGTEVVYAVSGSSTTGSDTRNFGFVAEPEPHYTWQTPNNGYAVITDSPYSVSATFINDGDLDLVLDSATVTPQIYGTYTPTPGTAKLSSKTCGGTMHPQSTCTISVSYNPQSISCTGSPYGYAYTGIDLSLATNAPGASTDFIERFTVTGVPICDNLN